MIGNPFENLNEGSKISNSGLGGKYKNVWVEESFNFEHSSEKQFISKETRNFLGSSISPKRIVFLALLIVAGISIIYFRIFFLQIVRGEYYRNLAEGNRIRIRPIPAERGIFYDAFGKELVQNIPSFSLSIVPQDFPREKKTRANIITKISSMSGVPEKNIYELLEKYGSYSYESLVIKENLDYESALNLYIQNADLPGVLVEKGTKRKYLTENPDNQADTAVSISHLLGYLGKLNYDELSSLREDGYLPMDNIGKTGLEKVYEKELRGIYGKKKIEADALGREQSVLAEQSPKPGKNMVLTIDLEAQKKMEELIKNSLKKTGKKRAVGIALNPQNGNIVAMVSWPSFDNNDFSGGITVKKYEEYIEDKERPLFNRAINGAYPSGSTAKLMVAAAALEEKIITKKTTVSSVGGIQVGDWYFKDWLAGGHGTTNVIRALAWSVNTFFYYVGGGYKSFDGLGIEKITKYLKEFGVGSRLGIDLPGEVEGFVPSAEWKKEVKNEPWYIGDTYNLSIGQGDLLATPLQVANWTATVVNGGRVVQPHLLDKAIDTVEKQVFVFNPRILNENFVSKENLEIVKEGLRECVVSGSCQALKYVGFTVGGKTGTAQWSSVKNTHAWTTAFAPVADPKIVVTVLVEEGGEGSAAAMPIVRDFLIWWGEKYLGISPPKPKPAVSTTSTPSVLGVPTSTTATGTSF